MKAVVLGSLVVLAVVSIMIIPTVSGDQGDILWDETFGGTDEDRGRYATETSDGGFIMTGESKSYGSGNRDLWLLKTDENGSEEWNETFGGSGEDLGFVVQETSDGEFVVCGFTSPGTNRNQRDLWIVKTFANGTLNWSRTYGGTSQEEGRFLIETDDGGLIFTGFTGSYGSGGLDIWVIKTYANGTEQWNETYGWQYRDEGHSIRPTSDGGYILGGRGAPPSGGGGQDLVLMKIDDEGTLDWTETWGGSGMDEAWDAQEIEGGDILVSGRTFSYGQGNGDLYLIKTDGNGSEEFEKTYGGSKEDLGKLFTETPDGNYAIIGRTRSYVSGGSSDIDIWLLVVDSDGVEIVNETYAGNGWDEARSILMTSDGNYIIAGSYGDTDRDETHFWLLKLEGPPPNVAPELVNGDHDPKNGNTYTWYNFTVTYRDANNDTPAFVYANIDGTNHSMDKVNSTDDDFVGGVDYHYRTRLTAGDHDYYFVTDDGVHTNSTTVRTTGTVIPEFGSLAVMISVTMFAMVLIWARRRR